MVRDLSIDVGPVLGEDRPVELSFFRRIGVRFGNSLLLSIVDRTASVPLVSFAFYRGRVFPGLDFRDGNFVPYLQSLDGVSNAFIVTVMGYEVIHRRLRPAFRGSGWDRLMDSYACAN